MGSGRFFDSESKMKLIKKLYELFRIEDFELDFGIFKILQFKRKQIEKFINSEIENILDSSWTQQTADTLYEHIYNFFSRYYDNGDFIIKRRHSKTGKYMFLYNGEDVNIHWNTMDQYYIKSSDYFPAFSWKLNDITIMFQTSKENIQLEKANAKEQANKYFFIKKIENKKNNKIEFTFSYKELEVHEIKKIYEMIQSKSLTQTEINKYNSKIILESLHPDIKSLLEKKHKKINGEESEYSELEWKLQRFTGKNTIDFFIHKDLKKFLQQELEYYLKSEMIDIQSILTIVNSVNSLKTYKELKKEGEEQEGEKQEGEKQEEEEQEGEEQEGEEQEEKEQMRHKHNNNIKNQVNSQHKIATIEIIPVFINICSKIIDFLSQIEEFQKILWEKPKFIINTDYLITLDMISEEYYAEILQNSSQIEEWKNLNLISSNEDRPRKDKKLESYTDKENQCEINIDIEYLKTHPTLMIDTKFFDQKFKLKILQPIENLEEKITGILIHSDNFHALRLLQQKYKNKIKCCYIDPPYNIAGDEFIYKDNFRDSSWLTMVANRLELCKTLLSTDGMFFSSIDDTMLAPYSMLINSIFPERLKNIVWHKKTQPSFLSNELIPVTEYILVAKNSTEKIEMVGGFGNPDKPAELLNISNKKDKRIIPKNAVIIQNGWSGILQERFYGKDELQIELLNAPIHVVNGIPEKDLELLGRFKWTQDRILQEIQKGGTLFIKSIESLRPTMKRIFEAPIVKAPISLLSKKLDENIPTNTDGNNELKDLFKVCPFNYPKPSGLIKYLIRTITYQNKSGWVLDFFAGSGTTGDAAIQLIKEEDYDLKFILIEMGEYFNSILKPRIIKKIYSQNWKDGKPEDSDGLPKRIIKYHSLEQYEDSILNIEFQPQNNKIEQIQDYFITYMLNFESKSNNVFLSIDSLKNPFSYSINFITESGMQSITIDIVETLNYLIGIQTNKITWKENPIANYLLIEGKINTKNALIIWRETKKEFDPIKEKEILEYWIPNKEKFDEIYLPGDSLIDHTESLESIFKKHFV